MDGGSVVLNQPQQLRHFSVSGFLTLPVWQSHNELRFPLIFLKRMLRFNRVALIAIRIENY